MSTPLPSLRTLTRELRELHAAWSHPDAGGEYVSLCYDENEGVWVAHVPVNDYPWVSCYGREFIPGSVERECPKCYPPARWIGYDAWGEKCPDCNGSGRVSVPSPFDATAAARRLLAAAREAT